VLFSVAMVLSRTFAKTSRLQPSAAGLATSGHWVVHFFREWISLKRKALRGSAARADHADLDIDARGQREAFV